MTTRHDILSETEATRHSAEQLLRSLLDYRTQSERNLAELRQGDLFKSVTGKSALDNAITSTQRMIEALNRVLARTKRELTDEDLAAMDGERGA
ncbi:MAG: hypothetical protein JNM80_06150 [Phycisphaerae bacterium]|nr:hypothetical protein [Phycisphaerae bacterium]